MSSTWLLPDGSFSTEVSPAPVNYRDGSGQWQPIDNTLVDSTAAGVAVENAANAYSVRLPQDASAKPVRFAAAGEWVSFAMRGLDGAPSVSGATATYPDAGADAAAVSFEATAIGVKESITLTAAPAGPVSFDYDLSVSEGLSPVVGGDGSVEIRNAAGAVVFTIPPGFMTDSAAPEPATSTAVDYALTENGGGWLLTVTPDQGWLADPARVYPVVVDPTVTDQPPVTDCWLEEAAQTTSHCGTATDYLRVGLDGAGKLRRSLVNFGLSGIPANATVSSADLKLYLDHLESRTSASGDYAARRVTGPSPVTTAGTWTNAATWVKRNSTTNWGTAGGDFATSTVPAIPLGGSTDGYKTWDVTAMTQGWVDGTYPNYGILVKQSPESVDNSLGFFSADSADSTKWPKLVVTYTEPAITDTAPAQAGDRRFFTYTTEQLTDRLKARVNVGNGNLLLTANDAKAAGVAGLDLTFDRTYNSALAGSSGTDTSKLGPGWSDNLGGSVRLEFPNGDDKRVFFRGPSGYRVRFEKNPGGGYIRYEPGLEGNLRYDASSNTLRVEMFDKQVYVFQPYSAGVTRGQLKELRDKQGNHITFSYNTDGTLAQATDTRGRTAVFSYRTGTGLDGMLGSVELRTPTGTPLIRYTYDYTATTPARLASSTLSYVNTTALPDTVDATNVGAATTYGYDANGRLNQIKDARENTGTQLLGGTTTIDYNTAGQVQTLTRHTDDTTLPDSTSGYTYATDTGSSTPCNGDGTHRTTVDGERTDVTDTTTYCADGNDRIRRVVDAKGHIRQTEYTSNSNVSTFDASGLDSGGSAFTFSYDSNDNPTSATTPDQGTASAQYADSANPNFPTSMRDFDTGGDTSKPATWTYDYDDNGNLIEAKAPITSGKNTAYRYCWDGKGQLQRIDPIDAAGNQSVTLDNDTAAGCGTASQGNDTLYGYDADGQLTSIDPPGTHRSQTYTYDALSRVKTITDGRGVVTTYTYDGLDHVTAETFDATGVTPAPAGPTTATVTWTYDPAGNMTDLDDPTGHLNFTYDELNRRTIQSQEAPANTKTYTYDPADNLLSVAVSDEPEATKYTYDEVNLVKDIDDQRIGVNKTTFAYDQHDKRTKTTFPMPGGNDVIQRATYSDGGQLKCIYSYRANAVPTGAGDNTCPNSTAGNLLTFTGYDYTKPGTPSLNTNSIYTATEKGNVTTSYTYDPISRLTGATTKTGAGTTLRSFTYDYDRHSNLVKDITTGTTPGLLTGTTTLAYNDAEELCWTVTGTSTNGCGTAPAGATTYNYDGAGALTGDSTGLALAYNTIGQTSSVDPAGTIGALPMTYAGVSQDRRLTKDTLEMSYGFAGLTSQSTNSGVPHAEWFVRDPDGKLIAQIDAKTTSPDRYYLMAAHDNVVATIDTTGAVRRYLYQPYGQQIRTWIDTNPTNNTTTGGTPPDGSETTPADTNPDTNPWRYNSGYYDTETGMLKYGTRYYMPNLARWTQADPKAGRPQQPLTLNTYLFAGANPINNSDSTGRDLDEWFGIGLIDSFGLAGASELAYVGGELLMAAYAATTVTAGIALGVTAGIVIVGSVALIAGAYYLTSEYAN